MAAVPLHSFVLPPSVKTAEQLRAELEFRGAEEALVLGIPELDELLPRGGLPWGSVVELQVCGASGAATSFSLVACRAAQAEQPPGSERRWCAFIDPSASLFAPGVAQLGVDLRRLLVVRPPVEAIERVALRIAEARAVSLLVIDLRGALGELSLAGHHWARTVRRLALAVKPLACSVLLLTRREREGALSAHATSRWEGAGEAAPLPVAMRLEFSRKSRKVFEVRVAKERTGQISSPECVPWSVFRKRPMHERRAHAEAEPAREWSAVRRAS